MQLLGWAVVKTQLLWVCRSLLLRRGGGGGSLANQRVICIHCTAPSTVLTLKLRNTSDGFNVSRFTPASVAQPAHLIRTTTQPHYNASCTLANYHFQTGPPRSFFPFLPVSLSTAIVRAFPIPRFPHRAPHCVHELNRALPSRGTQAIGASRVLSHWQEYRQV
jgi:hypothetical protein